MSHLRSMRAGLALLLTLALPAQAQESEADDPPDRVGRVAVVEGNVSIRPPEQTDWTAAVLNYPVAAGTALYTESGARTELSFGNAAVRLDGLTEATITRLEDGAIGVRVDRGSINLRLNHPIDSTRVAVDTPRGRFDIITAGAYHIDAGGTDKPTRIAVLEGEARFAGKTYQGIRTGEALDIRGNPETVTTGRAEQTAFDAWAMARDRVAVAPQTERYVSTATPGYQELDRAGTWGQAPEYGAVWYPTAVPVGWAPYRHGHWAWVHPWGWTWIDDAHWGFAPFHYGRWAYYRDRWCWVPGPVVRRPIYSPALVAFVGGPSLIIQIGGRRQPAVGWVPLAPREVYRPPYRHSTTYVRNINITHVERNVVNNITIRDRDDDRGMDRFANRRAATVVSEDAMRRSERIDRAAIRRDDDGPALNDARTTRDLPQRTAPTEQRRGPPMRSVAPDATPDRRDQPEQRGRDRNDPPARSTDRPATPSATPEVRRTAPDGERTARPERTERPRNETLRQDNPPAATERQEGSRQEGTRPEGRRPEGQRQDGPPRFERRQDPTPGTTETRRPDSQPRTDAPARSDRPREASPTGEPRRFEGQGRPERQRDTPQQQGETRRPDPSSAATPAAPSARPMVIEPQRRQEQPRQEQPRVERPREAAPAPSIQRQEAPRQEAPAQRMSRPEPQAKQAERPQPLPQQREQPRGGGRPDCPPGAPCKN